MTTILENANGVRITEGGKMHGHYVAEGALCCCGEHLIVAPMIFHADHRKGDPVMVCGDHGVHAFRFLELVRGQQPEKAPCAALSSANSQRDRSSRRTNEERLKMLKVLLKAKRIPDGSVVSKPTGEKKYTLKFNVKIYSEAGNTTITAEKGTVFLVGLDAINAVSEDCELKWHVEEEVLLDWIHWQQEELDELC